EGQRDMQNISGFVTEKGMSLPNDDLDLQLVWLHAMEQEGPYKMSSNILGEYWISYIPPHWNEYGIGKANLKIGLLPPLSGEIDNDKWKHSNGAWIRSEIWACLTPGFVDIVKKYAYMDACVDHGYGEGTYAEIFTASLECAAFTNRNIKEIIDYALKQIPEDCRVAKAVKLVIDSYDRGVDWKITRNLLVEQSADIGWF
ncbi:MAG TPA: ADP-ribosylglycohydrolase family protein, partial [Clostridiales bacterium]|nr:ADP-ribosylglycohydrolase family protein [Clostridiales bacterium]